MSTDITKAAELAESLRAMRRNAKNAYVSARPGAHHSITMDSVRLGDLSDAADLLEKLAAEVGQLNAPAMLLTDAEVRSVHQSCRHVPPGAMLLDLCGNALPIGEILDGVVRDAEAAVLAANGKAVP